MGFTSVAAPSDPGRHRFFRGRWAEPEPQKQTRPALGGTSNQAQAKSTSNSPLNTATDRSRQRACPLIARRAGQCWVPIVIGHNPAVRRLSLIIAAPKRVLA